MLLKSIVGMGTDGRPQGSRPTISVYSRVRPLWSPVEKNDTVVRSQRKN